MIFCHCDLDGITGTSQNAGMAGSETPKGPQKTTKIPKTAGEVLSLSKTDASDLCSHLRIRFAKPTNLPPLQEALLKHYGFITDPSVVQPALSDTSQGFSESVLKQMADMNEKLADRLAEKLTDGLGAVTAQVAGLAERLATSERSNTELIGRLATAEKANAELTARLARVEDGLQTRINGGMAPAELQAAAEKAAVQAVADASELEKRKLKLRITRLPPEVKSQTDAERMVPELLDALHCSPVVEKVSFIPPSTYAAVTSGAAPSPNKTGSILVDMGTVQDKLWVLKLRKHLRDSQRFRSTGVNEDLTKRQQEAKNAAWPAFKQARQQGKRAYWQADRLFVDGEPYCPSPVVHTSPVPNATPTGPVTTAVPLSTSQ